MILFAILTGVLVWQLHSNSRARLIRSQRLVRVRGAKERYSNLLLEDYGIPMNVRNSGSGRKVHVLFPRLNDCGDVEYIWAWHQLQAVDSIPKRPRPAQSLDLTGASRISALIQEHLQIDAEIRHLDQQAEQIHDLARLVATSNLYAEQFDLYQRALDQTDELLRQAKKLEQVYIRLIRETLIGLKLNQYNPDNLQSKLIDIETRYQQLKDDYWHMKDEAKAYLELSKLARGRQ